MARTVAGAALTEAHRQGQLRVRAAALRSFVAVWPLWEGDDASFGRLADATVPLVAFHHHLSSALAAGYYQSFRAAERVRGQATPRVADPPVEMRVRATLRVTVADMTRRAIAAGQTPEAAMQTALVRASGSVTRLTLEGGRDAIVRSSAEDREARGWARVTSGSCCAFCAMIASNGAHFSEDTADFEAHDHCGCSGEPAYEGSDLPGRGQEFRDLWNEHASGTDDPLNNFRRVIEDRV